MTDLSSLAADELEIFVRDYLPRIRNLEARAEAAQKAGEDAKQPRRMGEPSEFAAIVLERDELYKAARKEAFYVGTQAPRRSAWKHLIEGHQMRRGEALDALPPDIQMLERFVGFNVETFPEVLAPIGITYVKHGVDGEQRRWSDFTEAERDRFLDELGEGNFSTIWQNIVGLYRGVSISPKLMPLGSQGTQENLETSA